MSSPTRAILSRTRPVISVTDATSCAGRVLCMSAKSASSISAKRTATLARPASGATETTSRPYSCRSRKWRANSGSAVMWSTGIVKKPWIWPACRSMVSTRSAPASWSMSATSRAEIGSRGFAFRSWREYGNQGITAVIRFDEPSFAAWIISSSSMTFRSTGRLPVWTMKTSEPRIDSRYRQYVSPFANVSSCTSPSSTPSFSAIRFASSGCDRPEKTISRFRGPRSIQCPGLGSVRSPTSSSPGSRASSVVALSMLVDPAFLRRLLRGEACQRPRRDVLGDDRASGDPCVVADCHRREERVVDRGLDVLSDPRPTLREPGPVGEVRRDVARRDVRVGVDFGVADVGQVRHLRSLADSGVLDLYEGPGLRPGFAHRAGSKVTERSDRHSGADRRIDDDRVRTDLRARADSRAAAEDRERMDRRVLLDLDRRLDPRRRGIDDRDAGEHVLLVEAVAEDPSRLSELGPVVDPDRSLRLGAAVGGGAAARGDDRRDRVREVKLALRVR